MPSLSDGVMVLYIYYLIGLNENKRIHERKREQTSKEPHPNKISQ